MRGAAKPGISSQARSSAPRGAPAAPRPVREGAAFEIHRSPLAERALVALAAALPPFAAYLATLQPSIPAGDSGELITVAATLGVAHPPGYPLYTLLAHAWAAIVPFGSIAWRMNLFSAVCAAAACGVIALAVLALTRARPAAPAAAWTLGFSLPLWKNAVVAEVFALNALLAAVAWLAFVHAMAAPPNERPPGAALLVLAFLSTLLLAHHHTLALLIVPLLAVTIARRWGPGFVRRLVGGGARHALGAHGLALLGAAALLGVLPLLHLVVAARGDGLAWGETDSVRGFLRHVLRADYGTFHLAPVAAGMRADRSHNLLFLESLPAEFGVPALLLAAAGIVGGARRRAVGFALLGFAAVQALFFTRVAFPTDVPLLRGVIERFYILPGVAIALLAGLGVPELLRLARSPRARLATGAACAALALAWPVVAHARLANQRGQRLVDQLGRALLASTPERGVLFIQGDVQHNVLEYLTRVERLRSDVTVLDQELMTYDWYVRQVRRRDPHLLPPLGAAQHIRLSDGRTFDGFAVARPGGRVDLLIEDGHVSVDSSAIVRIEPADAARLYARSRAGFRTGPLLPPSDDRYSGLPGTRNVLWLDHLAGRRPAAFVGLKDESWTLAYEMAPRGLVAVAYPKGAGPSLERQADEALATLGACEIDAYFGAHEPNSFERVERRGIAQFVARAALLACQPDGARRIAAAAAAPAADSAAARVRRGHARLLAFAVRYEALDPPPDPEALRAIGFLRIYDAAFADRAQARRDLERYLATGPTGPNADEARAMLGGL